jgi:hypothetical protein
MSSLHARNGRRLVTIERPVDSHDVNWVKREAVAAKTAVRDCPHRRPRTLGQSQERKDIMIRDFKPPITVEWLSDLFNEILENDFGRNLQRELTPDDIKRFAKRFNEWLIGPVANLAGQPT